MGPYLTQEQSRTQYENSTYRAKTVTYERKSCYVEVEAPVVEEELLSGADVALGEDADAVVAVDHHHLGAAVGVDRVVGEADLVAFARRVNDVLCEKSITIVDE